MVMVKVQPIDVRPVIAAALEHVDSVNLARRKITQRYERGGVMIVRTEYESFDGDVSVRDLRSGLRLYEGSVEDLRWKETWVDTDVIGDEVAEQCGNGPLPETFDCDLDGELVDRVAQWVEGDPEAARVMLRTINRQGPS